MMPIKFFSMQQTAFKNNDDLILGIRIILSKYRCSFSEEDEILLNECITKLEKQESEPDLLEKAKMAADVLELIMRIFVICHQFTDLLS